MRNNELKKLAHQTGDIVASIAAFIKEQSGKITANHIEEKSELDGFVSYVDRMAEAQLVEQLHNLLPEATFLTEEGTVKSSFSDLQWVIDPLDGTTNFLYGVPLYSVSVALRAGDDILLGVVHHVSQQEQFLAWKGGGAFCNGRQVYTSMRTQLRNGLIATSFPHQHLEGLLWWVQSVQRFMAEGRGLRRLGSAALELAWVAAGRLDVFFEAGLNTWDVAAGAVLVQEAGGRTSDFEGGMAYFPKKQLLATCPGLFDAALSIVQNPLKEGYMV